MKYNTRPDKLHFDIKDPCVRLWSVCGHSRKGKRRRRRRGGRRREAGTSVLLPISKAILSMVGARIIIAAMQMPRRTEGKLWV